MEKWESNQLTCVCGFHGKTSYQNLNDREKSQKTRNGVRHNVLFSLAEKPPIRTRKINSNLHISVVIVHTPHYAELLISY